MKEYQVVISGEARDMLISHMHFLAAVNPEAAHHLRDSIISEIRELRKMPERFPYLDPENRRSLYHKMYVPNHYLVIYLVENDTVFVEYILDCRQDYAWLLP